MKNFLLYSLYAFIFNILIAKNGLAINIAVSIKPLHSLVSMVTDGVVTPELIVKGNTSSHSIQLSSKMVKQINDSDVVFIASKYLEVPIYKAMNSNNGKTIYQIVTFKNLTLLTFNYNNLIFKEVNTSMNNEGVIDYHVWLDPKNAAIILLEVANILSKKDPNNAKKYKDNAIKFSKKIEKLHITLKQYFINYKFSSYILYHNGFAYLENRYNIHNAGIMLTGCDASSHILGNAFSNKKLLYLSTFIKQNNITCVFIEPEFNNKVLINFLNQNKIKYSIIDAIGYDIKPGKELYFNLLLNILNSFKICLN